MDKKTKQKLDLRHKVKNAVSGLFAALMVFGMASPVLGTAVNAEDDTATAAPSDRTDGTDSTADSADSSTDTESSTDSASSDGADASADDADKTQISASAEKAVHLTINGYGTLEIAGNKYSSEDSGKFDDTIKIDTSDTSFFEFTIKADDGYTLSSYTGNSGDGNPADVYIRAAYDKDNKEIANTYTGYISLHTDSTDLEVNLKKAKFRKAIIRRAAAVSAEDAVFNADWASIASYAESKWTGMIYGQPYDCSALVSQAFMEKGVNVSGNTGYWTNLLNNLVRQGKCTYTDTSVSGSWQTGGSVTSDMAQKGDIVIFYTDDARTAGNSTHMGFMMGGANYFSALYDGTRTMDINRYTIGGAKTGVKLRIYHKNASRQVSAVIQKNSKLPDITNGNAKYADLTATFQIYDKKGGTLLGEVTTNSNGYAKSPAYTVGNDVTSLYVKEKTAPTNYYLDSDSAAGKTQTIGNDGVAAFSGSSAFTDTPKTDPAIISITKQDADARTYTGDLSGAVFKIVYTDGGSTTRTWYIQTKLNSTGKSYIARLDADHLVNNSTYSSDALYYSKDEHVAIPVGHLTITEVAPASGYTTSGGYIMSVTGSNAGETVAANDLLEYDIVDSGSAVSAVAANKAVSQDIIKKETPARGTVTVAKNDAETGALVQGDATFAGAEFDIKYVKGASDDAGMKLDTNGDGIGDSKEFKPGDVVYHITLDQNGTWSPLKADGSVNTTFLGDGSYQLIETKAPAGYQNKDRDGNAVVIDFSINTNGQPNDLMVLEKVIRGGFEFKKLDVQTGEDHQGNAKSLKGTFGVVLDSDNAVIVNGTQYNKGDTVFTFETNDDGYYKSTADLLPYGTYHIYEITAPADYEKTDATTALTIRRNGKIVSADYNIDTGSVTSTTTALANQIYRGGFTFQKLDSQWGTRTAGDNTSLKGTFKLVNRSAYAVDVDTDGDGKDESYGVGKTIYTFETDKKGYYSSDDSMGTRFLPVGTYEIVEVTAPEHYSKTDDTVTFSITDDNEVKACQYTLDGWRLTAAGDNTLTDKEFSGDFKLTKLKTKGLSYKASYEKGAVFDVVLARYVYAVSGKKEGDTITREDILNAYDARNTAQVTDAKGDSYTGFADNEYDEITTDKNGNATTKKLAYGTYFYAQRSASDSETEVVNNYFTFEVNSEHQATESLAPIVNTPKLYTIQIEKKDADTGETVKLDSATYKIKCLSLDNPSNDPDYTLDKLSNAEKLQLGIGKDNYVTWVNESNEKYSTFMTYATDTADGETRAKEVFYPVKEAKGTVTGYVNEPAKVPAGTYQLIEVGAPKSFKLGTLTNISKDGVFHVYADSTYKKSADDGTYTICITNYNHQLTGSLYLEKTLDGWKEADKAVKEENGTYTEFDMNDLSQFGFTLTAAEDIISPDDGSVLVKKGKDAVVLTHDLSSPYAEVGIRYCNADGSLVIDNLPVGHYTLTEAAQPSGTVKSGKTYDVVVAADSKDSNKSVVTVDGKANSIDNKVQVPFEIANSVTKTEISKTDIGGDEVEGAKIQIIDNATNEVVDSFTSTKKPHKIAGLTVDRDYRLVETGAPGSYVKASDVVFHVNNDGTVAKQTMVDKLVEVSKKDVGGTEIKGAQMSVTDESGKVVDIWTSDGTDHKVKGLEEGKSYVLHEVAAPGGYVKATDIPFEVKGADKNGVKKNQHIDMTDKRVLAQKVDMCGTAVEGAELTVTDEAGNVVDSWTVDKDNQHYVSGLIAGEAYTVSETKVPEGFVKMADYKFTVADDQKDQTETMTDKQVEISKTDVGGKELPGAVLTILDENGNTVDKWSSGSTTHYASNLEVGKTYTLHEDTAPLGYVKQTDVTFTVTDDGTDQKVTMVDTIDKVAKTDENGDLVDGAALEVTDGDGNVIDKWTSGQQILNLTEEQTAELKAGKSVEYTQDDGTKVKVYVLSGVSSDKETDNDGRKEETADVKAACNVKLGKSAAVGSADPVPGADGCYIYEAAVTGTDGTVHYYEIDETGKETNHMISGLTAGGTYTLTETASPDGYYVAKSQDFTADGTKDAVVTMADNSIQYEIAKVDDNGKNVAGVTLTLTDVTDPKNPVEVELPNKGVTTDENMVLDKALKAGHKYSLAESKIKSGVFKAENVEFEVAVNGTSDPIVITMVDMLTHISVVKTDNHGNPVAGAKLQIIEAEPKTDETAAPDNSTSDSSTVTDDSSDGTTAAEKFAAENPDDYQAFIASVMLDAGVDQDTAAAEIDKYLNDGVTLSLSSDGHLQIMDKAYSTDPSDTTDTDSTAAADTASDNKAADTADSTVEYVPVKNEDGSDKVVYEFTSTDQLTGVDISDYVEGGKTYILRETEAPYGFTTIKDQVFTVTGMADAAQAVVAVDQRAQFKVQVTKTDAADKSKTLAGAEITLFTPDGKVANDVNGKPCVAKTDKNGVATFTVEYNEDLVNSKDGGYYALETVSPKGYKLNRSKFNVNTAKDYDFSQVYAITIADKSNNVSTGVAVGTGAAAAFAACAVVLAIATKKKHSDNKSESDDSKN